LKIARIVFELDFGGVEKVTELAVNGFQSIYGISLGTISLGRGGRVSESLIKEGDTVWVMYQKGQDSFFFIDFQTGKILSEAKFPVQVNIQFHLPVCP
jgi:hypothetical protein